MVSKCAVNLCPSKARSKLSFFSFPLKNPDLCEQWVQTCCREEPGWTPDSSSRVCELHFTDVDYETLSVGKSARKKLRDGVIPSQNLPPGAPFFVTVMEDGSESLVTLQGHHVQLETVVTDGTHYDTMEHVSHGELGSIGVDDSLEPLEDDQSKLNMIQISGSEAPKVKKNSKAFDTNYIPEDISANTMNIDHEYFLSFLPPPKTEGAESLQTEMDSAKTVTEITKTEEDEEFPNVFERIKNMSPDEKIEKLVSDLKIAYRKNRSLAKANKSLRLQLHQASKKTLSMKSKHEIARDVLSPFFTPTQIDCFCRPNFLRSRNWTDKDFEIALSLRKLMSKKAFGFIRKKRYIPMPSLTSLRKYQRIHGIQIHHATSKGSGQGSSKKTVAKKAAAGKAKPVLSSNIVQVKHNYGASPIVFSNASVPVSNSNLTTVVQGGNFFVTSLDGGSLLDGSGNTVSYSSNKILQAVQIPVSNSTFVDDNGQQIQLQVVEALPTTKLGHSNKLDENWKVVKISSSPDGSSTYALEPK